MFTLLTKEEFPVTGIWLEGDMKFLLVKVSNTVPYFISLLTIPYEEWDGNYCFELDNRRVYIQKEYVELYQYYIKHSAYPESVVDIASNYPSIQSYWDNYNGFWDEEEKLRMKNMGVLPGRMFVPFTEGITFWWWPIGAEDMSKARIAKNSFVITPPHWALELKSLGLKPILSFTPKRSEVSDSIFSCSY